jgi:hypothetical protein
MDGAARSPLVSIERQRREQFAQGTIRMAVIGASPVTFISEDTEPGKQYQVPLSLLSFNSSTGRVPPPSGWPEANNPLKPNDVKVLQTVLNSMVSQGFLVAPPV